MSSSPMMSKLIPGWTEFVTGVAVLLSGKRKQDTRPSMSQMSLNRLRFAAINALQDGHSPGNLQSVLSQVVRDWQLVKQATTSETKKGET